MGGKESFAINVSQLRAANMGHVLNRLSVTVTSTGVDVIAK